MSLRLVLLGDPVAHSLSPAIHAAVLDALGIDGRYTARRVGPEGVRQAAAEMRQGSLDGANVTMPHKALAAELADELTPEAGRARSVNTWVAAGGLITGHSTDVTGLRAVWDSRGLPDGPCLVLGTGGAAAAALVALDGRPLLVSGRRPTAAADLAARLGVGARTVAWGEAAPGAIVVNATPIGMGGEMLPVGVVEDAAGLVDLVYAARPTPAIALATRRGIPWADGLDHLVAQAEASFRLWTGLEPPAGLMERVARNDSSGRPPTPTSEHEADG